MCNIFTTPISPSEMQLTKTIVLLAFVAYAHTQQCGDCPSTVNGENLIESCIAHAGILTLTYCDYSAGSFCIYDDVCT
ncbi:hypothetical protein EDC04DRAFT_1479860 [Pisolithus marmoratus]|nr:hypothetical protein EDC04DRAFT_1479860 [Pisolithus marmoratus]